MYNKLNNNYNKRRIYNYEDEPPEKKLISDGDILIKQLAEKQRNTQINLDEQLSSKNQFYKSTEEVSVTSYTSGSSSLKEFSSVLQHSSDVEKLKSCGLTSEEIELYFDYKSGQECMKNKHKNINESVLKASLEEIFKKIKDSNNEHEKDQTKNNRLNTELNLAAKPASIETKLLKFALQNQQKCKEVLPGPMDQIKDIERRLVSDLSVANIKKIRKKARRLTKQIEAASSPVINEPLVKGRGQNLLSEASKWDLREAPINYSQRSEPKVFTCKPQNYYTVKNGQIIKVNSSAVIEDHVNKLSIEEIKKIPKFQNYEKGTASRVLYLKNLANGVLEKDLEQILGEFSKYVVSFNIMKGRMQGQAFIEFGDEQVAGKALDQCNGIILKNKPVIIQFGRRTCSGS